ncbi:metal-dependent hydrolase [Marinicrinis sediminis]|uniref:UPF0173 metal-dependent hydrolase ACFSUC_17115 n=1 Tax=Marinicrinis sediminis TaxID=1652465 RepID=A0ABW5REB9_9BACL
MEIWYHGHSCIQLIDGEHALIIDPFISGNELAVTKPEDVQVDAVLLTHAHMDHILDAVPIAKANQAPIVATFELANYMSWKGADTKPMNIGGSMDLGFATVQMVQAFHSSAIVDEETQQIIYAGMPGGFIVHWNGKTIYHAGDTALFSDMKLIGEQNEIDVAFIPIGDVFTMGPDEAVIAAEWIGAKKVIPIHYNTFPPIQQDPHHFAERIREVALTGTDSSTISHKMTSHVLAPGDRLEC